MTVDSGTKKQDYSIFLRVGIADIKTYVSKKIQTEMNRVTKKNPPETTELKMILSNYDEYSSSSIKGADSIFADLMPSPMTQGKIFIGFPTFQTTGCSIQLAGQFIPTVERESIDFVDKTLGLWNRELLSIGGLFARIMFEHDIDQIKIILDQITPDSQSEKWINYKFAHSFNSFSFNASTPSVYVSNIIANFFFQMCLKPLRIISNRGILPIQQVRIAAIDMKGFSKITPLIPGIIIDSCEEIINRLSTSNSLLTMGFADALLEVQSRPFSSLELIEFMKWYASFQSKYTVLPADKVAVKKAMSWINVDGNIVKFDSITHFTSHRLVHPELPLPSYAIPIEISKHFLDKDLTTYFGGLQELSLQEWTRFIIHHKAFGSLAEKVMQNIGRLFPNISSIDAAIIISLLENENCILSTKGLVRPSLCYFPSVTLFNDLPKLAFLNPKSIPDSFMRRLGVRETVDLQYFFDRLGDLNWDQVQLVKYIASVQDKLTDSEWETIKRTPMFLSDQDSSKRVLASQLYVPRDTLKTLGLPLLQWNGKWKYLSSEESLLNRLGLLHYIPVSTLLLMITNSELPIKINLIEYMAKHFDEMYSKTYHPTKVTIPFIPTEKGGMAIPNECFSDPSVSVMNFHAISNLVKKHSLILGAKDAPDSKTLCCKLRSSPPSFEAAPGVFGFMASKQHTLSKHDWNELMTLRFIPFKKDGIIQYDSPSNMYFKDAVENEFAHLFAFIDFGTTANTFLKAWYKVN